MYICVLHNMQYIHTYNTYTCKCTCALLLFVSFLTECLGLRERVRKLLGQELCNQDFSLSSASDWL